MADQINIEKKVGAGSYNPCYIGDWITWEPWTDTGPFSAGESYTYRARREIDGVFSEYSNESAVVYSLGNPHYYYAQQ